MVGTPDISQQLYAFQGVNVNHAYVGQIDYDLDHLDPSLPLGDVVQDLPTAVQIQPRKHVLSIGHADCTAPTRKHDLDPTDHTDHTDHTDQESIYYPDRSRT